ncbi:L-rhamnose mutarotase [Salinisphaera sp. RV14]|uniref:L-rhamnose mutarotase n=1 Tax=Salinisphaera sp. RV14 TaxID=3454140 RepID=UPI003F8326D8
MSTEAMPVRAFEMQRHPGRVAEYRRRHDAIWPELVDALHAAGVLDYRIFVNERSHRLLAVMWLADGHTVDALPELPVMRRWWDAMADLMETRHDNAPVTEDLTPVFVMPAANAEEGGQ